MTVFRISPFLSLIARMAIKSALGSHIKGPFTSTSDMAGVVAPVSFMKGSVFAAMLLVHARDVSVWFERKIDYTEADIEFYLNKILYEIGVSLEDIEHKDDLIKNIMNEITSVASSSSNNFVVANALESILVHLKQEISSVYARIPEEAKSELNSLNRTRINWLDNRLGNETPPNFIRRAYPDLIGNGLSRNQLRTLDRPLYTALANWLRKNTMPPDLDLPNKSESIIREGDITPDDVKEARRVLGRWAYRTQRASKDHNR